MSGSARSFKIILKAEKMLLPLTDNLKKKTISLTLISILYIIVITYLLLILYYLNCGNISILDHLHNMILITLLTKAYLSVR